MNSCPALRHPREYLIQPYLAGGACAGTRKLQPGSFRHIPVPARPGAESDNFMVNLNLIFSYRNIASRAGSPCRSQTACHRGPGKTSDLPRRRGGFDSSARSGPSAAALRPAGSDRG